MTFRVRIDPLAQRQIDQFAVYLRDYSKEFAIEQIERLDRILATDLAEAPLTWAYFPLTGAPNIGPSTRSTKTPEQSTSCCSGMRRAIRMRSTSERLAALVHNSSHSLWRHQGLRGSKQSSGPG